MSVAPQTALDLQVILAERLDLKANDFERYFEVYEKDGSLVVAIHRDSQGKTVWLERSMWVAVNNYAREMGGAWLPREKMWKFPLHEEAKVEKKQAKDYYEEAHEKIEKNLEAVKKAGEKAKPLTESWDKDLRILEENEKKKEEPSRIVLSEFNINFDFKDDEHIGLLKKQIQNGSQLEIVCYKEDDILKVIDGGHTLKAYQELGLDPLENAKITIIEFETDADKLAFSRRRNTARLQQEPIRYARSLFKELQLRLPCSSKEETKKALRQYYNLKEHPEKFSDIEKYNNVVVLVERVFEGEKVKATSFISHNLSYLDFPPWLADMVDKKELSASQASIINNGKLKENEELQKRIAEICKGKEVRWTQDFVKEVLNFKPQKTAFWNFPKSSDVFGDPKFPGRCNGDLVRNILHYYSQEEDFVVDPMAGSGTTIDVCKLMNRKYFASDINPYRNDIEKWDITQGFPEETKDCDLIFLDPPYYKKKEDEYGEESVSSLNREQFLQFIAKLAKDCFETVKADGIVALLVSDYFAYARREIILSCEYWQLFKEAGFKDIMRITAPLPLASLKATWPEPEDNIHKLLDVNRDIYIFRKPKGDVE